MRSVARIALAHANPGDVSAAEDSLLAAAHAAAAVAAEHADAVDREARFPEEAFAALREQRLLGAMVPVALGGAGASLAMVTTICRILGEACAATGMICATSPVASSRKPLLQVPRMPSVSHVLRLCSV